MDTALGKQTWGMVLRNIDYTPQKYLLWVLEEFQYGYSPIDCGSMWTQYIWLSYRSNGHYNVIHPGYYTSLKDIAICSVNSTGQVQRLNVYSNGCPTSLKEFTCTVCHHSL